VPRAWVTGVVAATALGGAVLVAGPAQAAPRTIDCDAVSASSADGQTCRQLVGTAACVWNNGNGTWTMAMGYVNPTDAILQADIPENGNGGTLNALTATSGSAANPNHLAAFPPGTSTTAYTVTWSPRNSTDPVTWALMGTTRSWNRTITACPKKPVPVLGSVGGTAAGIGALGLLAWCGRRRIRPLLRPLAVA
jgi:hypothetical protein